MDTVTPTYRVDKTTWRRGPWDDEPDFWLTTTEHGYPAAAFRSAATGAWHAFIRVPPGHPAHGAAEGPCTRAVLVHGTVTYTGPRLPDGSAPPDSEEHPMPWLDGPRMPWLDAMVHATASATGWPGPADDGSGWWIGWDYGHAGDLSPAPTANLADIFDLAGVGLDGWKEIQPGIAEHHGNMIIYHTLAHLQTETRSVSYQLSRLADTTV